MLEIRHLQKSYSDNVALRRISFSAGRGELVALVGRNGAGKSTLMRLIAGCLQPDEGTIEFAKSPSLGYVPEGAPLYRELTPKAVLEFVLEVHGVKGKSLRDKVREIMQTLELEDVANQVLDTLSKGYQRRTALAFALAPDPQVLILDEPFDGFDPIQKEVAVALLKAISPQKLILFSTHSLSDAERLCNRLIIIEQGNIRLDAPPADVLRQTGTSTLDAAFRNLLGREQ
jgi:gliding motility-associated transport system ATP-binding protein